MPRHFVHSINRHRNRDLVRFGHRTETVWSIKEITFESGFQNNKNSACAMPPIQSIPEIDLIIDNKVI